MSYLFINISSVGAVNFEDGIGYVAEGETFEVTEDQAKQLAWQPVNFQPANDETTALCDQVLAPVDAPAEDANQTPSETPVTPENDDKTENI